MFDKYTFANIIKKIKETYDSQEDFSKKSEIGRTYLSQYMNMKLDEPPKPKTLEKLANASNGITSYDELMQTCGYSRITKITSSLFGNIITQDEWKSLFGKYEEIELTFNEQIAFYEIINNLDNIQHFNNEFYSVDFQYEDYIKNDYSKREKDVILRIYLFTLLIISKKINNKQLYDEVLTWVQNLSPLKVDSLNISYYMCPVYGQISAGQPNWAEGCIEGRLPIDPDLMGIVNPEEHFFLRVHGESMNKIIRNGAFALIHKQDTVENGEIAVVLVNGYDATLKKFTRQGELIILEPQSDDDNFKTQVYDKTTPINILGKYVGKMEFNK